MMMNYRKICKEHYGYTDQQMKGMHVHHIDGNHNNNSPENLLLCTPQEHATYHEHMGHDYIEWIKAQPGAAKKGGKVQGSKPKSQTFKNKMSERLKGNNYGSWERTPEFLDKLSLSLQGRSWTLDKPMNLDDAEVERRTLAMINKNKIQDVCPHCNKVGQRTNMLRWHFDKCKKLNYDRYYNSQ
jgi:hypothetical protein